jgi:hypothetical protein
MSEQNIGSPGTFEDEGLEDRPVFTREPTATGRGEGEVCVGRDARKHWSDKNPTKFTPDTALKIIQYVGAGCFFETAAAAAGISKVTFFDWLKRGERRNDPRSTEELRAWKISLDEAAALAEARAVRGIQAAGASSWQAYAWYLERKHPDRWRQRNSSILENPDGTPVAPPRLEVTLFEGGDSTTASETPPK